MFQLHRKERTLLRGSNLREEEKGVLIPVARRIELVAMIVSATECDGDSFVVAAFPDVHRPEINQPTGSEAID